MKRVSVPFLVFIIVFLILMAFSFGPLPKWVGNLGTKNGPPSPSVATPTPKPKPAVKLSCPVPEEFCPTAKVIDMGESFYALGFNLPVGTTLLAAFSGRIEDEPKVEGRPANQPLLYLRDRKGQEAIYSFYGTASLAVGTQVAVGQEIGKIREGSFPPIAPFSGLNSFFALKKGESYQKITPADFFSE